MKTRPRQLTCLASLLVCVAMSLPLQIAFLYDHGLTEPMQILAKMAPLNWVILLLAPLTACLTLRGSRWIALTAPLLGAAVTYNNLLVAESSEDYSPWTAAASTGLFFVALSSLLTKKVRLLLAKPELRWWLTPPRVRAAIPIRIHIHTRNLARRGGFGSTEFYTKTYDISEGGAFIPFEPEPGAGALIPSPAERNARGREVLGLPRDAIPVGTQCFVSLPLRGFERMQCRAEVVRIADSDVAGSYPGGIGIRFVGLSLAEVLKLKSLLSDIPMLQKPNETPASQANPAAAA